MAAIVKGTAHLYGLSGTVTNATVQSFKLKREHQNKDNTVDESGNEIERRYDDLKFDATIEIKIRSAFTEPDPGDMLTYNGVNYEIVSIERNETAKGFRMLTLTILKSQYVTYS